MGWGAEQEPLQLWPQESGRKGWFQDSRQLAIRLTLKSMAASEQEKELSCTGPPGVSADETPQSSSTFHPSIQPSCQQCRGPSLPPAHLCRLGPFLCLSYRNDKKEPEEPQSLYPLQPFPNVPRQSLLPLTLSGCSRE